MSPGFKLIRLIKNCPLTTYRETSCRAISECRYDHTAAIFTQKKTV